MRRELSPNPVLIKELRGRMRGPRAYLFLTAALLLLGGVSYGLYRVAAYVTQSSFGGAPQGALIGRGVFVGLAYTALLITCAAAPFLTAGAVSGEHERKTFDLLLATPLSPSSLLRGKLTAALCYIALVLLAAIPLASLSFVFGGVSVEDMVRALSLLLAIAVSLSVMGLFFSALTRRTGLALVASYVVLALLILGTGFAYVVNGAIGRPALPVWLPALNPFAALSSMLAASGGDYPQAWFPGMEILGPIVGRAGMAGAGGLVLSSRVPLWQHTLGLYAWLTAIMYLASTRLVRPVRRLRSRASAWAMACLVVIPLLAAPVVYGPFTPGRLAAWARWLRSSPHDLVVNGTFAAPLEQGWQVSVPSEDQSQVDQAEVDGRLALRLVREEEAAAEASVSQAISRTVPAAGWLQVRAVLRIEGQGDVLCGEQGDQCPLTISVTYDDADGRRHEWRQGFYMTSGGYAPFCLNCETRQPHIQVPRGEWYLYESPNLLESEELAAQWLATGMPYVLPPSPHLVHDITIAAAGSAYEVEVAEVALISREGRPLPGLSSDAGSPFRPTPVPRVSVPVRAVPVPTAAPAPTSTPEE